MRIALLRESETEPFLFSISPVIAYLTMRCRQCNIQIILVVCITHHVGNSISLLGNSSHIGCRSVVASRICSLSTSKKIVKVKEILFYGHFFNFGIIP